jgi:hypothetical protein
MDEIDFIGSSAMWCNALKRNWNESREASLTRLLRPPRFIGPEKAKKIASDKSSCMGRLCCFMLLNSSLSTCEKTLTCAMYQHVSSSNTSGRCYPRDISIP